MRYIRVVIGLVILFGSSPGAGLGGQAMEPVVAVHSVASTFKGSPCQFGPLGTPCEEFEVSRPSNELWWIYIVVVRADPVSGVGEFSIGLDRSPDQFVASWTLCADEEFQTGAWPEASTGNRFSWDPQVNCQRTEVGTDGVYAVGGAMWIYAYADADAWVRVTATKRLESRRFSSPTATELQPPWRPRAACWASAASRDSTPAWAMSR